METLGIQVLLQVEKKFTKSSKKYKSKKGSRKKGQVRKKPQKIRPEKVLTGKRIKKARKQRCTFY